MDARRRRQAAETDKPQWPYRERKGRAPVAKVKWTAVSAQKDAWADLVRTCAIASGREENNIKAYIGNAVLNRQLEALGEKAVADLLAMAKQEVLTAETRFRASAILKTARGNVEQKDNGSKAALSAVNLVYGSDAKFARAPHANKRAPNQKCTPRSSPRTTLAVGDCVTANFMAEGNYHDGVIQTVNEDGTFNVQYDDGDFESSVIRRLIRKQRADRVKEEEQAEDENEGEGEGEGEDEDEDEDEDPGIKGRDTSPRPSKMRATLGDGGRWWRAQAEAFLAEHDKPDGMNSQPMTPVEPVAHS
jgi:hypothetical protein